MDDQDGEKNLPLQRFRNFLVVDDAVLQSVASASFPNDTDVTAREKVAPYVKVVDAQHQRGARLPPTTSARSGRDVEPAKLFPGYMRVSVLELRFIWEKNFSYDLLVPCPRTLSDGEPDWSNRHKVF
ncbi:unnamed protein product [Aureobasidium vineae]|uniref:Uncharacterized protein n=1 Tax=Aureobasidium vineae TaxID=2773715 RepID=A0A9N8PIC8_9PEZI|nr:unnamed protein product [Aureobasidium vineae]